MSLLKINSSITSNNIDKSKKTFQCPYPSCNWTFPTNDKFQRHLRSHTKQKPYECPTCSKSFPNKYNVTSHQKIHEDLQCRKEGCNQVFTNQRDLKNHLKVTHKDGAKELKCPKKRCLNVFKSQAELKEHLANHDFLYKCEHCSKRFRKLSLLKLHSPVHEKKELAFKCTYENCRKTFATEQRLRRHFLIHENKRSFECPIENCGKSFNCPEYLRHHRRVHKPENKIRCIYPDCEKYFATTQTLKIHLQTHSECRPYKCDINGCQKSYLTASNLNFHRKLHETEKYQIKEKLLAKPPSITDDVNVGSDIFDNAPLFEVCTLNDDLLSFQDGVIAATVGEFAISQYVSQLDDNHSDNRDMQSLQRRKHYPDLTEKVNNRFQDDSMTNVYSMLDTNILSGHDYEPATRGGRTSKKSTNEELTFSCDPDHEIVSKYKDLCMPEDLMEASMELSTGHLVIDGSGISPLSCVPDHVYTSNRSTVNLDDIR